MKSPKKPMLNPPCPEYPSKKDNADRRAFLKKLGVAGMLGGAGMLMLACDNVDDEPPISNNREQIANDSEDPSTDSVAATATDSADESDTASRESDTAVTKDTETAAPIDSNGDTATETTIVIEPLPTDDGMMIGTLE